MSKLCLIKSKRYSTLPYYRISLKSSSYLCKRQQEQCHFTLVNLSVPVNVDFVENILNICLSEILLFSIAKRVPDKIVRFLQSQVAVATLVIIVPDVAHALVDQFHHHFVARCAF